MHVTADPIEVFGLQLYGGSKLFGEPGEVADGCAQLTGRLIIEGDLHAVRHFRHITRDATGHGGELRDVGKHGASQCVAGGARLVNRGTQFTVSWQRGGFGDGGLPFTEETGGGQQHHRIGGEWNATIDTELEHHPAALAQRN